MIDYDDHKGFCDSADPGHEAAVSSFMVQGVRDAVVANFQLDGLNGNK